MSFFQKPKVLGRCLPIVAKRLDNVLHVMVENLSVCGMGVGRALNIYSSGYLAFDICYSCHFISYFIHVHIICYFER